MTLSTRKHSENPMHSRHDGHAIQMRLELRQPPQQVVSPLILSPVVPQILPARVLTVSTTSDSGQGSLRQAILDANLSIISQNSIVFAIGSGPQTIRLHFALPAITREVILDATGQPGFAGLPLIQIDGRDVSQTHCATIGLHLAASHSTIKGLRIDHFTYGVKVQSGHGNTIEGNVIGGQSSNGTAAIFTGIMVRGGYGNLVRGNAVINSQGDGISFENSERNMIGGPFPWDSNRITATQDGSGVAFYQRSTKNLVHRNRLCGNSTGIFIDPFSEQNVVTGNRISNCVLAGIEVQGPDNVIGTKADFNTVHGVGCGSGIVVENRRNSVEGNFVTRACYSGIRLSNGAADTSVLSNVIFQNKGAGIDVQRTDTSQIGDFGRGNSIYDNGSYGICVQCGSNYNRISANCISGNAAVGIHLAPGSNDGQPAPVVSVAAAASAGCSVAGVVWGAANSTLAIELFSSRPGMLNQGERILATFTVATDEQGEGRFVITLPVADGNVITATSTNTTTGETSAFSNSLPATTSISGAALPADPTGS